MEVVVGQELWAGVDAGKSEHHGVVVDGDGQRLLSRRVANDEAALLDLIDAVTVLADGGEVTWAIDLNHGGAALLIAAADCSTSSTCSTSPAGPSTTPRAATGARARPTPRTPRHRRPGPHAPRPAAAATRRRDRGRPAHPDRASGDLIADRTRAINRLRAQLLEYFPALERAFDYSNSKAALILLTGYQTPDATSPSWHCAPGRVAAQTQGPQRQCRRNQCHGRC